MKKVKGNAKGAMKPARKQFIVQVAQSESSRATEVITVHPLRRRCDVELGTTALSEANQRNLVKKARTVMVEFLEVREQSYHSHADPGIIVAPRRPLRHPVRKGNVIVQFF